MKKLTTQEFIAKAKVIHGNRYDYSHTTYINSRTSVDIICKEHGTFRQIANIHMGGHGCPLCKSERTKKVVCGVGVNDVIGAKRTIAWRKWMSMLTRCYGVDDFGNKPTYADCSVCNEWLLFSKFKEWFNENYVEGYVLDKDLLIRGNKVYSPNTCCFVPQRINTLILDRGNDRGACPVGVSKHGNKFSAGVNIEGKRKHLGLFNTAEEAFIAYKCEKEQYIKDIATAYYNDGKISTKVYNALMCWKIHIAD